jgi:multidrug resistance protein
MAGFVLGPLFFGPLSEYVGRRPVLVSTFLGYMVFMAACSMAPSYELLLVFRLLGGICASAPTTVISGLYADIYDNPSHRGTAVALYMGITTVGPLVGPIISGFASEISWRWPFWIALFIALPGLPLVLALPETYVPVLHNKAMRVQEKSQYIHQLGDKRQALEARKIFVRPAVLMITQPMLPLASLYVAFAYAIMFLTFQAYPIIFQGEFP